MVDYLDLRDDPQLPRKYSGVNEYGNKPGYYRQRSETIRMIVIHNSGGEETVYSDNAYHESASFFGSAPHIAYGMHIERTGLVVICNYDWERTWHATNANDFAFGICLQGNLDQHEPTDEQLASLQDALQNKCPELSINVPRDQVFGHGEQILRAYSNNTVCPGQYMRGKVVDYREGKDFSAGPVPQQPHDPAITLPATQRYFPETGQYLANGFKAFWDQNGGLPIFGLPITAEYFDSELGFVVQYTERARFEFHEATLDPWRVQLGLVGKELLGLRK